MKESCFLEKQRALEALRGQLEEDKRESLVKSEDRMTRRLAELGEKAAVSLNKAGYIAANTESHLCFFFFGPMSYLHTLRNYLPP